MRRHSLLFAAALLVLTGCSSDNQTKPDPTTAPTSEATESPTPTPGPTAVGPEDLVVTLGAVGPARAGMSKADAIKTGLFEADVPPPVEGCPPYELQWKKLFTGLDVLTRDDGSIASIGISKGGPKTAEGIGFGSTLTDLRKAYPNLSPVVDAGFSQAGAYEFSDKEYIGFLFGDATVSTIKGSSKITFMEVTVGEKPELIRSGC